MEQGVISDGRGSGQQHNLCLVSEGHVNSHLQSAFFVKKLYFTGEARKE